MSGCGAQTDSAVREWREVAHIRHERVPHTCGFQGYTRSGWWAGVPV